MVEVRAIAFRAGRVALDRTPSGRVVRALRRRAALATIAFAGHAHPACDLDGGATAAYVIFDAPPCGDAEVMKPYREKAFDTLIPYGGKAIVRTNEIDVREIRNEKPWSPTRLLVIEFPTLDAARAWYASRDYQALLPLRINRGGPDNMIIVPGVD